jgi:hypothetical protein
MSSSAFNAGSESSESTAAEKTVRSAPASSKKGTGIHALVADMVPFPRRHPSAGDSWRGNQTASILVTNRSQQFEGDLLPELVSGHSERLAT